jgi:hypothetical protein
MTILLEMIGFTSYTEFLSRALTPAQLAKLSPADRKARRLAQVRACRARQKMVKAVARCAAPASGRDIIDLYAYSIIDA